jgi:hypothetical protein
MTALLYRMPAGIPGEVNRAQSSKIEANIITPTGTSGHPTMLGGPVVMDATSKAMRLPTTGDAAASIYGFLCRRYPSGPGAGGNDPLGTGTPPDSGVCDVLRSGYITTKLYGATAAAKGGQVYVRLDNAGAGQVNGGVEAASDTTHTVAPANCTFMGPADANGNVEISFNI